MQKVFNQNLAAESSPHHKYQLPAEAGPQGSKFTVLKKIGEGISSEVFLIEEEQRPAKTSFDSMEDVEEEKSLAKSHFAVKLFYRDD